VTLKVSKARALLPSRKRLQTEREVSSRRLELSVRSYKDVLKGPLLPNGKYWSTDGKPPLETRCPRKLDWDLTPRSKIDPVNISAILLSKKERDLISKGPSRKFRRCIPSGPFTVDCDRTSVSNFNRRMHALNAMNTSLRKVASMPGSLWMTKSTIKSWLPLLPEILWNADKGKGSLLERTRNFLGFSLRKASRRTVNH